MPRISFEPAGKACEVNEGITILEASNAQQVGLSSCCGGQAVCTTCRVEVLRGMDHLSPVGDYEGDMLELLRIPLLRLACQTRVYGDVVVRIP
jgi:ferredoxin